MGQAVILDPYQPYARLLIERLYRNHGVQTICLHSDWRRRLLLEGRHRILRSDAVAAHYMLDDLDWAAVARGLLRRHNVVGVLPFEEGLVLPMIALAEELDLSWSQPDVQRAFRDRCSLKQLVAQRDSTVRLNAFTTVTDMHQVIDFVQARSIDRYVLKPNAGSGNQEVQFFDHASPRSDIVNYLANVRGVVLLEEFISGPEFFVNGQMDESSNPTVVGVGVYYREHANGVQNLQVGTASLSPDDPRYQSLAAYADAVMRATGLRRSPFHLEAIIDQKGPCLVEVAARFCGELGTLRDQWRQGPDVDLIDVAAHYYVSDRALGPLPLDPARERRVWTASVTGASDFSQRLISVEGTQELQSDPHFLFWVKKPAPGDHVDHTTNLTTRPWSVVLKGRHDEAPLPLIQYARGLIRMQGTAEMPWNPGQRCAMYQGVASKAWSSRPRPYELKALLRPLK